MRRAALALALLTSSCASDYWVRSDAAAAAGWVAARRVGDEAPVAIRDDKLRTWHTRNDGTRRVSGEFRSRLAFGGGLILTVMGLGAATLGVAFAASRPDPLGINQSLGLYVGASGAAVALVGGGLLWLGWPVPVRSEPLSAHPGAGEPPPPPPSDR